MSKLNFTIANKWPSELMLEWGAPWKPTSESKIFLPVEQIRRVVP